MKFNLEQLRLDLKNALLRYPDLADDEILRADTLEGATDIKEALTALVLAVSENRTMADALTTRLEELTDRRARFARRVELLREMILSVLQAANLKKLELPEATVSQRASPPQIIGEVSADALPDDLVRIKREPNKTAIREALLAHREVPGLYLSNSPPALTIKVK
jgi:hypothetical protein